MTKKQEIEIKILPDGKVDLHLEGFGKACDQYIKMIQEILNAQVKDKKYTTEYFTANVDDQNQDRVKS